ncbi:MAG TPA: helix-turn-helix domain-containing protein [Verrucomicrobiae bacterium]|nr:helix-turn-helix domain-containing protein [Verrucomicrobiae bacterium]
MHFAVYIPSNFYAALAATIAEVLQAANDVTGTSFTYEYISHETNAISKSGIQFATRTTPSRKIDVLIVLAGIESERERTLHLLEQEAVRVKRLVSQALNDNAYIAASCGAAYLLASNGLLDGKAATISWWLKEEVTRRFPQVHWNTSQMVIKSGRIYTGAAAFSGLELISRLLIDMGFSSQEQLIRKLLVLPPVREFQSPYVVDQDSSRNTFESKIKGIAMQDLAACNISVLARMLGVSERTFARKCLQELNITPGKWLQVIRLEAAKQLLSSSNFTIQQICDRIGYQDTASFSRLFTRTNNLAPGEFRKQLMSKT